MRKGRMNSRICAPYEIGKKPRGIKGRKEGKRGYRRSR